ncbi:hypothetical protein ABW636_13470 [Aquimarina sp. 2201CG1-2-11]|uniref:hypothetical protein n=1 Tax=Aquimarina discodermiae TaxID=3231043 RepID=UPI00346212C5
MKRLKMNFGSLFTVLFLATLYACDKDALTDNQPTNAQEIVSKQNDVIYLENISTFQKTPLRDIGIDPRENSVFGDKYSTERTNNVRNFVENCGDKLRKRGVLQEAPLFFVYRSVAAGGVARKLTEFAAKPLLIKAKSIDPSIILTGSLRRLSGLLPTNTLLSKSKTPGIVTGIDSRYRVIKEDMEKFILYYNPNRELKWFKSTETPPKEWKVCEFAGNNKSTPYIADWDLVTIGVQKSIFKNWKGDKSIMDIINAGKLGIVPVWMQEVLNDIGHFDLNATQHGSESLYCGNDIRNESFFIASISGRPGSDVKSEVITNWNAFISKMKKEEANGYFLYEFDPFDGTSKKLNLSSEIIKLNKKINGIFP